MYVCEFLFHSYKFDTLLLTVEIARSAAHDYIH